MNHTALWWLLLNILSTIALAFYSMEEMACISINKVRLHYYVNKGIKRAVWINYLLQHPAKLFATTLFCVNVAMFIGSECSRELYLALGINPDIAPLTQVIFIVIFGELAPMFAARRYAEHVALLGAPVLYASAKILGPLLWGLDVISRLANRLAGGKETHTSTHLPLEDLQRILDEQDENQTSDSEGEYVNAVARNIFILRNKDAKQVMQPLNALKMLPSNATIEQVYRLLRDFNIDYIPIYHRDPSHIIGVTKARELIRIPDNRKVRDYTSPPWFITQNMDAIHILKEFRYNNRNVAVVLDAQGLAIGVITLEDLTQEIFGKLDTIAPKAAPLFILNRTFPGGTLVSDFNKEFGVILDQDSSLTLAELMMKNLGHTPAIGDSISLPPFELTVEETTLMEIKKINITNKIA